jgi:hypothetical protein
VSQTLFFIGLEKAIQNIERYEFQKNLSLDKFINLTTEEVLNLYPNLPNHLQFKSNWTQNDASTYFNHLLLRNFFKFKSGNQSLNIELRVRLLGPYKIKSIRTFINSLGYFIHIVASVSWRILLKSINKSPEYLLLELRRIGKLGKGDIDHFKKLLLENKVKSVLTFSTLRDPKLFDMSMACEALNLDLHYFPECWDNISTGYAFPTYMTHMHLWSQQQLEHVKLLNRDFRGDIDIYGSYRASHAASYNLQLCSDTASSRSFTILYLEGYFYEDLDFVIDKIINIFSNWGFSKPLDVAEINLVIRRYPLKRQSAGSKLLKSNINQTLYLGGTKINITESKNFKLADDLGDSHIVLSELTTAGIEAALSGCRVIFVGSKRSPRYLDTSMGYRFFFARELPKYFEYIEFDSRLDQIRLATIIISLISGNLNLETNWPLKFSSKKELTYFAEEFDLAKWDSLLIQLEQIL